MTTVNATITSHGARYNKLKRPDDFLTATTLANEGTESNFTPPTATIKRTLDDADLSDDEDDVIEELHKRPRLQNFQGNARKQNTGNGQGRSKGHRPTTGENGMQSMFPGMIDDGNISDESTNEALAYLRGVRSEASSIPSLLVAPAAPEEQKSNRSMYESVRGDHRVIYEDGTWIARDPDYLQEAPSEESDDPDPQDQYYINLLRRYQSMRKTMDRPAKVPPSPAVGKASTKRIASAVPKNRHEWLYILDREYPSPALISGMSDHHVFAGLKYCAHSLDRFKSITKQKSCWIWALLAKAPESGTMDYAKFGCIRDLGHKAGQFGLRLRSGADQAGQNGQEEEEEGEVEMWEAEGEDGPEDGEVNDGETATEPPENTASAIAVAQEDGDAQGTTNADSEAEMSISSSEEEEGEGREDTTAAPAPAPTLSSTNDTPLESTDDEPTTLEDARARLLAQLGDRLVQTPTPPTPSTTHGKTRQPFVSRAHAERHRQSSRSGPMHQDTPSIAVKSKDDGEVEMEEIDADIDIPDLNTRVTIDMVLTVVAECYGQRDLLRFRDVWYRL